MQCAAKVETRAILFNQTSISIKLASCFHLNISIMYITLIKYLMVYQTKFWEQIMKTMKWTFWSLLFNLDGSKNITILFSIYSTSLPVNSEGNLSCSNSLVWMNSNLITDVKHGVSSYVFGQDFFYSMLKQMYKKTLCRKYLGYMFSNKIIRKLYSNEHVKYLKDLFIPMQIVLII